MKVTILKTTRKGNFTSPKWTRKYEDALKQVLEDFTKAEQATRYSEALELQCESVARALDHLFGEGTALEVLGGDPGLDICLDAFRDLATIYQEQINPKIKKKADKAKQRLSDTDE